MANGNSLDLPPAVRAWAEETTGAQEIVTFNPQTRMVMVNHRENPPQDAALYTLAECGVTLQDMTPAPEPEDEGPSVDAAGAYPPGPIYIPTWGPIFCCAVTCRSRH